MNNIKRAYNKPIIEEHLIDQVVNLWEGSIPGPQGSAVQQTNPTLKATPNYQDMPTQQDAFGTDTPDFSKL